MRFNELMTGIRQDVAVKVFGENLDSLLVYANKVNAIVQTIPGATAPQVERVDGLPQINIDYDRARIANYGLKIQNINDIVSTAFAGKAAGVVYENERKFDLVVRLDNEHRTSIEDVSNLFIPTPNGEQIPLSQVADINYKLGPAQISREDGKRRIYVGFNVQGRDVASVVKDIQDKLAQEVKLPSGYYVTYGGQFENLQKASDRLLIAVPISLLLIFVLLYFTFRSLKEAALVYAAIPMSAIGGVFALLLRDMPFSISAGVGFIALFGVAVLNGIVLIATFNRLEKEGWDDIVARVIEGTKTRLRPVLMTASVASLGFLPMALSTSAGAEGLSQNIQAQDISAYKAVRIALENNSGIKSKDLDVRAAESLKRTAYELPKTELNIQYGNNEGFEYNDGVMISQNIPFPTLFGAKKNLIKEQIKSKEWAKALSENELKKQVRTYYYQLEYLENNAKKLQYLDSIYLDFIRVAKLRYKTGDIGKIDVSTANTKRGEINLLSQQNEVLRKNAYLNLKNLMQIEEDFTIEKALEYKPVFISDIIDNDAVRNHPSIQSLYQEALVAEKSKKVERANGLPDFTLGYSNISLIGEHSKNGVEKFYGRGQRFGFVDVGISIPIFTTTRSRVRSLETQKESAEMNAQWQENVLKTEMKNAMTQYEQNVSQFNYFIEQAIPNAEEIINASRLGYSTGDLSYVEYLFAVQTATDTYLNYLKSIQQINESVIVIYSLINK